MSVAGVTAVSASFKDSTVGPIQLNAATNTVSQDRPKRCDDVATSFETGKMIEMSRIKGTVVILLHPAQLSPQYSYAVSYAESRAWTNVDPRRRIVDSPKIDSSVLFEPGLGGMRVMRMGS